MIKITATLLVIALCLVGCRRDAGRPDYDASNVGIVTIESCEYLAFKTAYDYVAFTHKGNCKYCAQRKISGLMDTAQAVSFAKKLIEDGMFQVDTTLISTIRFKK